MNDLERTAYEKLRNSSIKAISQMQQLKAAIEQLKEIANFAGYKIDEETGELIKVE